MLRDTENTRPHLYHRVQGSLHGRVAAKSAAHPITAASVGVGRAAPRERAEPAHQAADLHEVEPCSTKHKRNKQCWTG